MKAFSSFIFILGLFYLTGCEQDEITTPTCADGIQNGTEAGVDCGGSCDPCAIEASCNDGIQNGDETGVDCGGSCPACATCDDGIQNGEETDIDCGGPDCDPCYSCGEAITDIEGNTYQTVNINGQCWMAENLRTTSLNDGTAISQVTDNTVWTQTSTASYCIYDNQALNEVAYGKLYNWYTVATGNLCPEGWRVPVQAEYEALITFLGGNSVAGGKLKSTSNLWNQPNVGATNSSGFSALPGGIRYAYNGEYFGSGENTSFWTITNSTNDLVSTLYIANFEAYAGISDFEKGGAASCRCVKD